MLGWLLLSSAPGAEPLALQPVIYSDVLQSSLGEQVELFSACALLAAATPDRPRFVEITVAVSSSGRAMEWDPALAPVHAEPLSAAFQACIREQISSLILPAPPGGEARLHSVTLVFSDPAGPPTVRAVSGGEELRNGLGIGSLGRLSMLEELDDKVEGLGGPGEREPTGRSGGPSPTAEGLSSTYPGGEVVVGEELIVEGALTRAQIDPVLERTLAQARSCYQRELETSPGMSGQISIQLVIARDGSVARSEILSSTLSNRTVEGCIQGRFMRLSFPRPADAGQVVVTCTLKMIPPGTP